ncbi:hypothetical protein H3U50_08295 [Lactobacillus sp. M0398]|uniref:hypothetical protein n=1 Tax=unclassified Lactobacillus TaxID=2620435 RepID=UPI0018DDA246|nr:MULTISPECIES: hypothetical protein [unclassified Lactobacillus]MBI0121796.1 hypothetical protein [Lactobacillus sp. M0398]MBI0122109.1 hypothetical protein [Lactobacillus sp. W8174]MBI0134827.1 hypothetical protein [Lactobacillus sp. W8173]
MSRGTSGVAPETCVSCVYTIATCSYLLPRPYIAMSGIEPGYNHYRNFFEKVINEKT